MSRVLACQAQTTHTVTEIDVPLPSSVEVVHTSQKFLENLSEALMFRFTELA